VFVFLSLYLDRKKSDNNLGPSLFPVA